KEFAMLKQAFNNAVKGKSQRCDTKTTNKKGQTLYVTLTFTPIQSEKGHVDGVILMVQDNTIHKQLEDSLELSKSNLHNAHEIAQIVSWEYMISTQQLRCSDHIFNLYVLDKADHISMQEPLALIHKDDYQTVQDTITQALKDGTGYQHEYRIYHGKTGELKYIAVQAEAVWQDNIPYKLVGVIKDQTTQKQLEMTLAETNEHLRFIFDNLNAGIWMKDVSSGKLTYVSKGVENILHVPVKHLYEQ